MQYIELNVKLSPMVPFAEILMAKLAYAGYDTFEETGEGFKTWIPEGDYRREAFSEIVETIHTQLHTIEFTEEIIPARNWNEIWESNFTPVEEGSCIIRAPFHPRPAGKAIDIVIEPKMSFGTGHHQTTRLMVRQMLKIPMQGLNVLDMGAGTAVLSILASKLGARSILAIDIDEWAYLNGLENIKTNEVSNAQVKQGGAELLGDRQFNLILANINRNIILRDFPRYNSVLEKGGLLLISGFLDVDVDILNETIHPQGFTLHTVETVDHWSLLGFRKD